MTAMCQPTDQLRFRGCLLGGAVGDALGAPVEFMPIAEITRGFGQRAGVELLCVMRRLPGWAERTRTRRCHFENLVAAHARNVSGPKVFG
jgi:ADP-ribosyl-[dinitrogen reductase] hydrolase